MNKSTPWRPLRSLANRTWYLARFNFNGTGDELLENQRGQPRMYKTYQTATIAANRVNEED